MRPELTVACTPSALFFFTSTAPTAIYTLSLHDALPISKSAPRRPARPCDTSEHRRGIVVEPRDRKSTRLNSSHANISYAVFCLKKKKHDAVADGNTQIDTAQDFDLLSGQTLSRDQIRNR